MHYNCPVPRLRILIACCAVPLLGALAGCGSSGGDGATPATSRTFSLHDPAYLRAVQAAKDRAATATTTTARVATAPPAPGATTGSAPPPAPTAPRPRIVQKPIPMTAQRKREMAAYSQRHYGQDTYRLTHPKVIVEHYTEGSFDAAYASFVPDAPDSELHELPGLCAHFVVDTDGTIYQLVPLRLRCRHTVGLNWTAIGIEQVGFSDREILDRPRQLRAVERLTAWLQCRYGIATKDVIGHNESLTSPYHHEDVAAMRTQTHDDWQKADMDVVRAKLRTFPCG